MSTFSERLRELRDEKKIPQRLMARDLQITPPTLSHWECGYQEPSFKDLIRLSKYFDVSIDYLLGLENDFGARVSTIPAEHLVPMSDGMTAKEREMLEAFRKLLPETQDFILRSAQSLRDKKNVT